MRTAGSHGGVVLTQVKTPHETFFMPQRLVIPPFQRPYVWTQEGQWEPLWDDVRRLADRSLAREANVSHFLGAIVIQQQEGQVGSLGTWTVIDGQQRLTTLQLLLDAIHEEVAHAGFEDIARQISDLVENPEHFIKGHPEHRFKVSPTNRDRTAFEEVMAAEPPIDYKTLERMGNPKFAAAHEYFAQAARTWLGDADMQTRARALVDAVSTNLQMVVINLLPHEDAQEIFETLNARGTPLTAADLIKNFVFQRLEGTSEQIEKASHQYWGPFETEYWEANVQAGPVTYSRSSLFFNQWLIAKTGKDVASKSVFSAFKSYVADNPRPMDTLLPEIRATADEYHRLAQEAAHPTHDLTRLGLFAYRTSTLKSEALRPVVIWLTDPNDTPVPPAQLTKAIENLESWLVRRACIRAGNKNYRDLTLSLLATLKAGNRESAGDIVQDFLARQSSPDTYWPTDDEVRTALRKLSIYKRFQRGRTRMLLEAVEDHRRGWDGPRPKHESRVRRGSLSIEHLMPQHWQAHWSPPKEGIDRDDLIHTLGNLTLTTSSLNSKVSNGPWHGTDTDPGKFEILSDSKFTAVSITQDAVKRGKKAWTDETIQARTDAMIDVILEIWPVPEGNVGLQNGAAPAVEVYVGIPDLLAAGLLTAGQRLHSHPPAYAGKECTVTEDGWLKVGDELFWSPSGAAKVFTVHAANGWYFWQTERDGGDRLKDLRDQYADERGLTAKNDEGEE